MLAGGEKNCTSSTMETAAQVGKNIDSYFEPGCDSRVFRGQALRDKLPWLYGATKFSLSSRFPYLIRKKGHSFIIGREVFFTNYYSRSYTYWINHQLVSEFQKIQIKVRFNFLDIYYPCEWRIELYWKYNFCPHLLITYFYGRDMFTGRPSVIVSIKRDSVNRTKGREVFQRSPIFPHTRANTTLLKGTWFWPIPGPFVIGPSRPHITNRGHYQPILSKKAVGSQMLTVHQVPNNSPNLSAAIRLHYRLCNTPRACGRTF